MPGTVLHLLRHGETVLPGRMTGRTDTMPTAEGIARCVVQADGLSFERIVSSDLVRARAAAEAIGKAHSRIVEVDPRWRELDFGEWDGKPADAVDPDALGRFWSDPDSCPPPRGECWSALAARVGEALDALDERPTLVVAHGGAMRAALSVLLGFAQPQLWAFALPCAARLSLEIWPGPAPRAQITGLAA
ncbi:MAG: histidine phosphatase family protein [Sphingobium sp.]|jgi:alpha-ribazole phosphatase|nr:MAG: histidine phosphatase family protein [Sphingobium sp.]